MRFLDSLFSLGMTESGRSRAVVEIDNNFSVPLAITYRTGSRSRTAKLTSAAYGVARTQGYDGENAFKYGLASFLMNLFDRLEFHTGLTPGYVAGKSREIYPSYHYSGLGYWEKTWTEKPSSFSLSADAGLDISFRIWRFDLKLMPAFHYNITNNYRYHIQKGVRGSDEVCHKTLVFSQKSQETCLQGSHTDIYIENFNKLP